MCSSEVLSLKNPVLSLTEPHTCSMWVKVGSCAKLNLAWRHKLITNPTQYVTTVRKLLFHLRVPAVLLAIFLRTHTRSRTQIKTSKEIDGCSVVALSGDVWERARPTPPRARRELVKSIWTQRPSREGYLCLCCGQEEDESVMQL